MRAPQRQTHTGGFSLVELMISLTILSGVLWGVTVAVMNGQGAFERSMTSGDVQSQSRRVIDQMVRDLGGASRASLAPSATPPLGSSSISFQKPAGWKSGMIEWGPRIRYEVQLSPGELDNGVDDDGNGLVDEGMLVRIENVGKANERTRILTQGVSRFLEGEVDNGADDNGNGLQDEQGLSFDLDGDTLNVRLSLERLGPNGDLVVRTYETSVLLRN